MKKKLLTIFALFILILPISACGDEEAQTPSGVNTFSVTTELDYPSNIAENDKNYRLSDWAKVTGNGTFNQGNNFTVTVEYVSSALSESLYLLDPEIRDSGAILIDIGYLSSFVAYVKGDGILNLKAFSVGGGHISADLCQVLQLSFKEAENLKRKVVLSLAADDNDYYEVNVNGNITPVSAKLTNEIVASRLDDIVNLINRCLIKMKGNNYLPIYLTGGGICLVKGGKDYLSKGIGENIEIITSNVPQMNRPNYSSILGLLDIALKEKKNENLSLIDRIKNWLKK